MATRLATAQDALDFHSVREGDMIIEPNEGGVIYLRADEGLQTDGNPYTGNDINTPNRMLASLTAGKRIFFDGSAPFEDNVRIYLRDLDSLQISNVNGQFRINDTDNDANNYPTFALYGGTNIHVTFKYEDGVSGDPNYLGHDGGYAYSSGTYGMLLDRRGLAGDQSFTIEGDDKSEQYVDGRYLDYVAPEHYEIDYVEGAWGGFTFFDIKYAAGYTDRYNDFNIHDCYLHDVGSEGCYNGGNSINVSSGVLTNFLFHNNRIIRTGTEGMQWAMLGVGCKIYNNIIAFPAMQWKNNEFAFGLNTQAFQDGSLQFDIFDGSVEIKNNIILGGGNTIIRLNGTLTTYTDGSDPVVAGICKVYNNLFYGNRTGNFIYIGNNNPQVTDHLDLEIYDNYFGNLDNLYDEIGGSSADAYAIINNNEDNDINIHDNIHDSSMSFFIDRSNPANTGITNTNNTEAVVKAPVFTNWGLDDNHDYRNFEEWASVYGDYTPNDGNPIVYTAGDYVYVSSTKTIYECILEASSIEPPNETYWRIRKFPLTDTPILPPVSSFDPYGDISWLLAADPADASNIAVDEYWLNQGSDPDNLTKNGTDPVPVYNAGGGDPYLQFTAGSLTALQLLVNTPSATPYDIWIRFTMDTITSGAHQGLYSVGGNCQCRIIDSTGVVEIDGVATTLTVSAGVEYVMRVERDGIGGGSVTLNNGTPAEDVVSTGGASDGLLGARDTGALHTTHKQKELFIIASALSAEEVTDMWDYFGL